MAKRAFQFSILSLMATTALAATVLGFWIAEPSWWIGAIEVFAALVGPAFAAICLAQTKGYMRTFFTGVLVAAIAVAMELLFILGTHFYHFEATPSLTNDIRIGLRKTSHDFRVFVWLWALAPLLGVSCQCFRWLFFRNPQEGSTD